MATPFLGLSLAELSAYLPTTDLNIVTALNLDGGGSTMMSVNPQGFSIPSFDPVPTILAIYKN
jgi:exopolysaccharide biosynthesis protein